MSGEFICLSTQRGVSGIQSSVSHTQLTSSIIETDTEFTPNTKYGPTKTLSSE